MNNTQAIYAESRGWLPEPTLRRLPWYLAYVVMLRRDGVEYVSSRGIADAIGVDASQIAKDLSHLGVRGKTRIGYEVAALERELRDFLGFSSGHNAVIAGVGSLGGALIQDRGLQRYGLNIVAGIDTNPNLVGTRAGGIVIFGYESLRELIDEHDITIGIVAVPASQAQETADRLIDAGIRAIWNFTPFRIRVPEGIVITNTSIYSHLAVMYNRLDSQSRTKE
ncbi:MAG: redox-sensing transcriptional repressor Rex [Muribaculaceae bacterium]|nr:redox-sensing transcriptional repressor Rex [Muribaculaceae bacterium]MDE6542109.1 redox-sensing transcriptional repressor Rex [Muribaculaceae bacterium]